MFAAHGVHAMFENNIKKQSYLWTETCYIYQKKKKQGPTECLIFVVFSSLLAGPFRYLDLHGAKNLVNHMKKFQELYGDQFKPCQLLQDHANDSSKRFHKAAWWDTPLGY